MSTAYCYRPGRGLAHMQINVAEAKSKLSELLAAVDAGEDVVIARGGVPAARLVPVTSSHRRFGPLAGLVPDDSVPDFKEPMSADTEGQKGSVAGDGTIRSAP